MKRSHLGAHCRADVRGARERLAAMRARAHGARWGALAACMVFAGALSAQTAAEPSVVEVQWGDTFSAIASRYTGDLRSWRKMYDPQRTGLPNPDKIQVGMRLELVVESNNTRYLRLQLPSAAVAGVPPKPRPVPAAVAKPAPAAAVLSQARPPELPKLPATTPSAAVDAPLVIGVLPNIAAPALLAQYDHLKRYLERVGPQKVRIVVPAGFKLFFDATMRGDYDVAVAAPHFARVAQLDRGMVPIALYEPRINALLIAPADGKVGAVRDVAGKQVAFANPTSLVAMYGMQWLSQQKLEAGRDFDVKAARSDMGVGRMMLSGEAAAAVMSHGEMRALPADESARMKVVEVFARIPNFVVLAHPRLSQERMAQLRNQFKGFMAGQEEGLAFAQATGLTGIVDADEAVLKELDPYADATRKAMGVGK